MYVLYRLSSNLHKKRVTLILILHYFALCILFLAFHKLFYSLLFVLLDLSPEDLSIIHLLPQTELESLLFLVLIYPYYLILFLLVLSQ